MGGAAGTGCGSGSARREARTVLWGGQNTLRWKLKIAYRRVITIIIIIMSASLGLTEPFMPRQRGRSRGPKMAGAPPRPSLRPGRSRGGSDGVGVSDRSLHPQ